MKRWPIGQGVFEGPFTREKRRNGSVRNKYRFQTKSPVYTYKFCNVPTEKSTVLESPLKRVLDRLHVVFFETGNDRARDN